jgi:hypothetical protein
VDQINQLATDEIILKTQGIRRSKRLAYLVKTGESRRVSKSSLQELPTIDISKAFAETVPSAQLGREENPLYRPNEPLTIAPEAVVTTDHRKPSATTNRVSVGLRTIPGSPSIQALERAQGYIRLPNGRAVSGFAHEYERHGTTTLFAALETAAGLVKAGHYKPNAGAAGSSWIS